MRRPFQFAPTRLFALILCAVLLIGCATAPEGGVAGQGVLDEINDPLEPMNRAVFKFNQFADGLFFRPLALMYGDLVPDLARRGVRNFLDNLRTPVTLANDILQGKPGRAAITVKRFAINSTVGIGGLLDMATRFGVEERHREDFGQTLATWGSEEGVYLILPLLGPSNPRDAIGLVADGFLDPLNYVVPGEAVFGRTLVRGIDELEQVVDTLDEIERTSLDYYATIRSLIRQRRADEIRDGRPAPLVPIPSISFDEFDGIDGERLSQAN